jgi:hypothetical protein
LISVQAGRIIDNKASVKKTFMMAPKTNSYCIIS